MWDQNSGKTGFTLELVLHGGLGNQLYQLFYALCVSRMYDIKRVIVNQDHLSRYSTPRKFELGIFELDSLFGCDVDYSRSCFGGLRLPKFANKISQNESELKLGSILLVDGYFQNVNSYRRFSQIDLQECLTVLREAYFKNQPKAEDNLACLHHIRLSDGHFSIGDQQEIEFLESYFLSESPTFIMTDKEDVVRSIGKNVGCSSFHIVKSDSLSPCELLAKMGTFCAIKSNGSTLALWSSIIYSRELFSSNVMLMDFYKYVEPSLEHKNFE
jgi:hypothetical protein